MFFTKVVNMPRGARPGERRGGRAKGTQNHVNAKTREALWAEIERRVAIGEDANPFLVALKLMVAESDARVKLQCAEFLGDRLLPKLKATEHSGEITTHVITHRYGKAKRASS